MPEINTIRLNWWESFLETLCQIQVSCKTSELFVMSFQAHFLALCFPVILATSIAKAADVGPPMAPSGLKVTALGVNAFKLEWKDNSDNEVGWDVLVSLAGGKPQHYQFIQTANITSYTVFTNDLPGFGLVFQIAAYNGVTGEEAISDPSAVVAVRAQSPNTFSAPTEFTAKALDDGRVRLMWTDNSTSESGYEIEFKQSDAKKWEQLGTLDVDLEYNIVGSGLDPDKNYQFRARAFKSGGTNLSGFSNVAEAQTLPLRAPTKFEAIPDVEGSFSFKWMDRSNAESGFELQQNLGNGKFKSLGTVDANTTSTPQVKDFALDQEIEFRLRAYHEVGDQKTYSAFANIVTARSTRLAAPTTLIVKDAIDDSVSLKWKDMSSREASYLIYYRKVGSSSFSKVSADANSETFKVPNLTPGENYEFRVRAYEATYETESPPTETVTATTDDGILGNLNPLLTVGVRFSYKIRISDDTNLTNIRVTGLPPELKFNKVTRNITGTINHDGNYSITIKAIFSDGTISVRKLIIKSTTPPVVADAFNPKKIAVGNSSIVSVEGKFQDPDTASAARFQTTLGDFDIIFFPTAAPKTVNNFMDYMDALRYDNVIFHRAPPGFVVQTGGYRYSKSKGFREVVKFDAVVNEPGVSNLRGTVAMAKLGGQPDSATSEWFVNLDDNSANLDAQNEGFTVFGRVPDKGMVVIDQISNLPTASYDITVDSVVKSFDDVPVNSATAPVKLKPEKLVKILSSGPAPILIYKVTSANPSIATAAISGNEITIEGIAPGATTIQVKATDLDGNYVSQNISVTVP